ncbi:F-box/kelch-repeat protein At3g44120-like [Nicotiana tabacum]|uniref:F-box/kelch-repeat protein At3g44120-like n=1 Tax=Nicotiana tabacum TaxID=4097 RepID=A0AC58TNW4_TOBAC
MTSNTKSYPREEIVTDHIVVRKHFDSESIRPRLTVAKFGVDYNHDPEPLRAFDLFFLNEKIYAGCVPTYRRIYRCEGVSDFRGIYGPIDGLFLLEKGHFADNVRFAWWNPATKECSLIPRVEFELQERFQDCCRMVGIDLDRVNQDYKVVWLRTFWDEMTNDLYPKIFAALYSSKNDSWKYLEPNYSYECQLSVSQNCTYINGKYHWMTRSKEICNKDNVYSVRTFDFVTELFGEMTGPPIPGDHWATLMLRGGSLAAVFW